MKINRETTANARNNLGEVIGRARYANEPTIFLNRNKEVAAIVSIEFFRAAMEALGLEEEK